jgi:hypothetical protein
MTKSLERIAAIVEQAPRTTEEPAGDVAQIAGP